MNEPVAEVAVTQEKTPDTAEAAKVSVPIIPNSIPPIKAIPTIQYKPSLVAVHPIVKHEVPDLKKELSLS